MLKSYQLQQRAADHDIYAKIIEQWIQLNYVTSPYYNDYTAYYNKGYRSTRQGRVITTTIATLYVQFDHYYSMVSHATSTITHHI